MRKPKKPNYVPAMVVFVTMFMIAGAISLRSWDGVVYVYLDDSRSPAAIGRNLDFSHLDGRDLLLASQRRLVSSARVLLKEHAVGVELGHFVTRDKDGNKTLACRAYDRVSVEFRAEGIAESGHVPKMVIESLCKEGDDITKIRPIWIPVGDITSQVPGDLELQVWRDDPVAIKLSEMGSQWPKKWRMTSVRLFNKNSEDQGIVIGPEDVMGLREQPLRLEW